jgi:hypothetical protein
MRREARGLGYEDGVRLLSTRSGAGVGAGGTPSALGVLAREEFVRSGIKGPEDVRAPTGLGGFEVAYDPAAMVEWVRIGAAVQFRNGIEIVDGKAVAQEKDLGGIADWLNSEFGKDPLQLSRNAFRWQWTEGEKAAWLSRLKSSVEERWSRQFLFHATAEGFEGLQALASVDVDVQAGVQGPRDHLALEVFKTPPEQALNLGRLEYGEGGPLDNRMFLESGDVEGRRDDFGRDAFTFDEALPGLTRESFSSLKSWAIRFKAGTNTPPRIVARVQGYGARLVDSARERFEVMGGVLEAYGFDASRLSFEYAGPGSEAILLVGDGRPMVTADHEFGHAFGLKDEYAKDPGGGLDGKGKPAPAGAPTGHDELARCQGLPGAVYENSDGLMSLGEAMRPTYGAPFLWALKKVTRMDGWSDQPPVKGSAPDREGGQ